MEGSRQSFNKCTSLEFYLVGRDTIRMDRQFRVEFTTEILRGNLNVFPGSSFLSHLFTGS